MLKIPFENRYVQLGDSFYERIAPVPVKRPGLIRFNDTLAESLGINTDADDATLAAVFSGNRLPEGAEPLAMAYSGHQFGHFNPQLGDGRAVLLGEVTAPHGASYDIHFKGSGATRFSRNGDGRAALGPVLREYLVSEAMHRLGVPTTRALAAVTTGERVVRESLLPGGVITRVAASFVRVGTFQYFAARQDYDAVRRLADYIIEKTYPALRDADNPYHALLDAAVSRQAALIARWMHLGFIHGVMNTDNMAISGETIDYGPCAFMDAFDHHQVFSSIDRQGRYAYSNQPPIALWNLTRFAETLLPLFDDDPQTAVNKAQDVLETFMDRYRSAWLDGMRGKCGLTADAGVDNSQDIELAEALLDAMADGRADFTLTFDRLSRLPGEPHADRDESLRELFVNTAKLDAWLLRWRERLQRESASDGQRQAEMQSVNPIYIPRNHQIEAAIRAAEDRDDFAPFHELYEVLRQPYTEQPGKEQYRQAPEPDEVVEYTFCGT